MITKKLSHYTLKGQMRLFPLEEESPLSGLHGSKTKLDFILTYLKENPNQCYHGEMFDMSQSKVSEWVSYILPFLEENLTSIRSAHLIVHPKILSSRVEFIGMLNFTSY